MVPSVNGGPLLSACLASLAAQSDRDFEVVVIDNSEDGRVEREVQRARPEWQRIPQLRVVRAGKNLGFAEATNAGWRGSTGEYLATLNDDAEVHPEWLSALRGAMQTETHVGMCASRILLFGTGLLDSAGMVLAADGSSKQRGQGEPSSLYSEPCEVLFPSACAALYRREMLEDVGLFDADFFAYCEDTDLGLRARWNGWECRYVPSAIASHHYSQSAGAASPFKAFQIERNRLWVLAKNFPSRLLWRAPFAAVARYVWHLASLREGRSSAAKFHAGGNSLYSAGRILWRAHWSLISHGRELLRKRKAIRRGALLTARQFAALVARHSISIREIARL